ncbi:MAG: metallophosphoesterase [Bdellovibrionales bacterium]|nr:metallophosphoesterase [Bdellovibrionales bacterium]NQZ18080.1 metallophosphoesterase [Bdellovibrionales bacterium]
MNQSMWVRNCLAIIAIFISFKAQAQVRLIQWTDAHSTMTTLTQQMAAIDEKAQEFLARQPRGEVVIHVIGDFSSLNPYNSEDGGWKEYEALRILKERGYTVLYTPGNHDAFDWSFKRDGADLFLEQIRYLRDSGVEILADNLRNKTEAFRSLVSEYYSLRTLQGDWRLVGLTIAELMSQSNLTKETADKLFGSVERYQRSFSRIIGRMAREGASHVIFGIHQGHVKLSKKTELIQRVQEESSRPVEVPLIMGAHTHKGAFFQKNGIHFSEAGSHGSFSVIDYDQRGRMGDVHHVAINRASLAQAPLESFEKGHRFVNRWTESQIKDLPWLEPYHQELKAHIEAAEAQLSRVLVRTRGIPQQRFDLREGPSELGRMLAQSRVDWSKQTAVVHRSTDIFIGMVNSSAYRVENMLAQGEMTELIFRLLYPSKTEANLFRMSGLDFRNLYLSLRESYSNGDPRLYSLQVNYEIKEVKNELLLQVDGRWVKINNGENYWVALDGWLADRQFGQSFHIKQWMSRLFGAVPVANSSVQDIFGEYMPRVIERAEARNFPVRFCRQVFQR